jgi:hypothetical protein
MTEDHAPKNPLAIALYLPQYHPIPENDSWWGKGFTEWTNVGKAKPLYPGHYQPHVPSDLGYYDLRLEETRVEQAQMAKKYGLDGFSYWHYWFGNEKRLLENPFEEVLESGKPNFPFCLGWANHSWEAKNWSTDRQKNKILIQQKYPGVEDCIAHFNCVSRAFHDKRYLTINEKPIFLVWEPLSVPTDFDYLQTWRDLAEKSGLKGIAFVGFTYFGSRIEEIYKLGYDYVLYDGILDAKNSSSGLSLFISKAIREVFSLPLKLKYSIYENVNMAVLLSNRALPCVIPNFDHTPRSGKRGLVLQSSPKLFNSFLKKIMSKISSGKISAPMIFIKSWNEWGEGNHLEPDLKYSHAYLEALRDGLGKKTAN